ncbi:MAG: hypothetical protein RLY16_2654, partial [Bacteroidota bacterium]
SFLVAVFFTQWAIAQQPVSNSNLRAGYITTQKNILLLDTLSIFPNTFSITGVGKEQYILDPVSATLTWLAKPSSDSVWVSYRVFPYRLNNKKQHINFEDVRNNFLLSKPVKIKNSSRQQTGLLDFGNINYNGSIGRGISFGNSQDAVVNSNLNLQISGFIGDSLELTAAVTDNNIPIQPDGNTQDLRDFDRIFLQVKKRTWQLNFGDIDIRQSRNYFLNFYKRLQGMSFVTENRIGKNIQNSLLFSGSVAKGKFNRNILTPVEGNQGPYRLQGANNELFFTILAGTERIFMDGELLVRGEDQDYVINYNTAELTFTPKRMITKDKRIQVEFEYADRNFLNSNIYVNNEMAIGKKWVVSVGAFSNQDARNSSINQSLDADQKQFLSQVGDGIDTAYYVGVTRDTFSSGKILYRKIDTLYNGNMHDSIFVFDNTPGQLLYSLGFTYLGPGKGNYTQLVNATNGKVFQWVAPDANNVKQGDWAPVQLLVTPKKLQMATVTTEYKIDDRTRFKAEVAVSKYDVNLFSKKDKGNDNGLAVKLQLNREQQPIKWWGKSMQLSTQFDYEMTQSRFKPIERIRNVEFKRDWSLTNDAIAADEQIIHAGLKLTGKANNRMVADVLNYHRSDGFNGWRQQLEYFGEFKGWRIQQNTSLTSVANSFDKGSYLRPTLDITKLIPAWKNMRLGVGYLGEQNVMRHQLSDTLTPLSFAFHVWKGFIKSDEKKLNKWALTYFTRTDLYPIKDQLGRADKSQNLNFFGEFLQNEQHQFRYNVTWRQLQILNTGLTRQRADESLLGRIEYFVNEWKGLLTGSILYEVGAGQEQKREYSFVEVPAGQGEYTWIDYNNNGLKELNEFELALFQDQRKYIRIFSPTNQYVKANYVQFNYSVDINPRALIPIKTAKGIKKVLSRMSTSSSLQINKKEVASGSFMFNPFTKILQDTSLLTLSSYLSNTLFINRVSPVWGLDVTHVLSNNKSLLTYGVEARKQRNLSLKGRWNINRKFNAGMLFKSMIHQLSTPKFGNRNYDVQQWQIEPSVSYVKGTKFRTTLSFSHQRKQNQIGYQELSINQMISA